MLLVCVYNGRHGIPRQQGDGVGRNGQVVLGVLLMFAVFVSVFVFLCMYTALVHHARGRRVGVQWVDRGRQRKCRWQRNCCVALFTLCPFDDGHDGGSPSIYKE